MSAFRERVIALACAIPRGKVTTYGRIARAAGGGAMAAQSVTSMLARAPKQVRAKIPFHRIVYADGTIWADDTVRDTRLALYKAEGIVLDARGRVSDLARYLHEYR
jgi:methylated-DNA-protein-cysteine methyltransferase-like protein